MPRFRYEAVDPEGATSTGELVVDAAGDAFARLERLGLEVVSVVEVRESTQLSAEEATEFVRQVGEMANSSLPMHSGLRALADELPTRGLKRAFLDMADRLERGESLDEAIEAEGNRFPEHIRGLVEAGTRSGRLGEVLSQYVDLDRAATDRERSLRASLAYPFLLIGIAGLVFVLLMNVVLDDFISIFRDFGLEVPPITRFVIAIGESVRGAGPWTILGPLAAIGSLRLIEQFVMTAAERRRLANEMPLFGPLWRWTSLAEFSHLLAVLLDAEIPLPKALPLAGRGVRDPALLEAGRQMASEIAGGSPLADSASRNPAFPSGFAKILRWAEPYQSLPQALHMAAALYEARAKTQAKFISTVLTIVTVVLTLTLAAIVYIGLFWPIYTLIGRLSG